MKLLFEIFLVVASALCCIGLLSKPSRDELARRELLREAMRHQERDKQDHQEFL